jgi:PKD repeat protein
MKKNMCKSSGRKKNAILWITFIIILNMLTPVTYSQNVKIISNQQIDSKVFNNYRYNNNRSPLPLDSDVPWWDIDWHFRKEIIIDYSKVDSSLFNFPVFISFGSDSDLVDNAQDNGDDIVFIDGNGVQLYHEIEYFDNFTGELVCWVNVTSISSTEDTSIFIYYGNLICGNQQNVAGTWDYDYKMVQHLNETIGVHYDSTSNGNDGTPMGGLNQNATGKCDGADEFDGIDDYINCGNGSSLSISDKLSVEAWINFTDIGNTSWRGVVTKNHYHDWAFAVGGTEAPGRVVIYISGSECNTTGNVISTSVINDSLWHYIIATCDGYTTRLYVDGIEEANSTTLNGTIHKSIENLIIGNYEESDKNFNGIIDEVRISNTMRDNAWIKTGYNNQFDPNTFYSVGDEESVNVKPMANFTYTPVNPSTQDIIQFNDTSTDADGFIVSWLWDFDDGIKSTVQNPKHQYSNSGIYDVNLTVTDNGGYTDNIIKSILVEKPNQPPSAPIITGPTNGKIETSYDYSFVSTDPEDDDIAEYVINWGDDIEETFTGPYTSGVSYDAGHTWTEQGIYTLKAKAKDTKGAESDWGILTVVISSEPKLKIRLKMLSIGQVSATIENVGEGSLSDINWNITVNGGIFRLIKRINVNSNGIIETLGVGEKQQISTLKKSIILRFCVAKVTVTATIGEQTFTHDQYVLVIGRLIFARPLLLKK